MLDEAYSGDSARELRDSHTGVSRWVTVSLIQDQVRGSRKPHPRAAHACGICLAWAQWDSIQKLGACG